MYVWTKRQSLKDKHVLHKSFKLLAHRYISSPNSSHAEAISHARAMYANGKLPAGSCNEMECGISRINILEQGIVYVYCLWSVFQLNKLFTTMNSKFTDETAYDTTKLHESHEDGS